LVSFSYLNSSEKTYYHSIRRAENYKSTYNLSLVLYPLGIETNNNIAFHENIAVGIGTSIQSSLIAILTLFSIITWVASLVAEEFSNKIKKELQNHRCVPCNKVDQWLREFHLFHCLVERINRCFGFLLFITLTNICIMSMYNWFFIARRLYENKLPKIQVFAEYGPPLTLLYFRLTILVIVSRRLQEKVYRL